MDIKIPTPRDFNFERTVISHGWSELLPFEFNQATWTLKRVLDNADGQPITVNITGKKRKLDVHISGRPSQRTVEKIARDVRHMLRLDDEMKLFYETMSKDADFDWIPRQGAGRLLRSPTVYEDLVKSLCTTNCSWALTDKMVAALVKYLGREGRDGRRAFPNAEAMAAMPESFYRDEVRAGYRAPYFKELPERVASGEIDVESWLKSELPTLELKREMKRVKGIGDYAAENLLKLVGRYDVLALDSWERPKFARLQGRGRACNDKRIARFYSRFREWRGLALWCDMTRDWFERADG